MTYNNWVHQYKQNIILISFPSQSSIGLSRTNGDFYNQLTYYNDSHNIRHKNASLKTYKIFVGFCAFRIYFRMRGDFLSVFRLELYLLILLSIRIEKKGSRAGNR